MAICNLFKKLEKQTGNFLLFSQYTEDLTKSMTQPGYYKVIPSKFYALNINYNQDCLSKYGDDINKSFPLFMLTEFENGCAIIKNLIKDQKNIPENWNRNLFIYVLHDIFNVKDTDIKYEGDINIQSYKEYDGMGYNELYCFIPTDAYEYKFTFDNSAGSSETIVTPDKDDKYLKGFNEEDEGKLTNMNWTAMLPINPSGQKYDLKYNCGINYIINKTDPGISDPPIKNNFDFNTIIILYDVILYKNNGEIETHMSDIPMGMYLTGIINDDRDGTVTNTQHKYVSNSDIYDSGTSYGLRISTRFITSPNSDALKLENIQIDDSQDPLYCRLMAEMAETQAKMDEILNQIYIKDQKYNELYNIFKNSRTNVPYIKNVNGEDRWFVNGRNVAPVAAEADIRVK